MFTRVQGNTMLFAMPLQGKTFYAGAIVVDDFVPESGDEITVIMQDRRAYTYTPTYTDGMLIWTDNGQLEVGTYSVEVLVDREDGTHLRCLRLNQVNIVESTEESELDSEMDGNGVYPSDVLSAAVFLFAGNGNLGIREIAQDVFNTSIGAVQTNIVNGYTSLIGSSIRPIIPDMWASLTGNTGDYMNILINANHIPIGSGLTLNPTTGRIDVTGGGGGGSVSLNQPLSAINEANLGLPSVDNSVISWNSTDGWCYKTPAILGAALASINNAGLPANPDASNKTIVWDGSAWTYAAITGGGGVVVNDVKFGDPTVPAEKDKLVVKKGDTDYYRDILFAQVAQKTRFSYTIGGTTYTDAEFPIDWLIAEEYEAGHFRLRVNPKYEGLYADGWIAAGGIGSGGGGGVSLNEPLSTINGTGLGTPSSNQLIAYSGSAWGYSNFVKGVRLNNDVPTYSTGDVTLGIKLDVATRTLYVGGPDNSIVIPVGGQSASGVQTVYVGSTEHAPDANGIVYLDSYPTIPSNVSSFNNDAGYLTQHQSLSAYSTTLEMQNWVNQQGFVTTDNDTTYKLTLNGTVNGDSSGTSLGSLYAPDNGGTAGYILVAGGTNTAPSWSSMIQVSNSGIDVAGTIDATGGISSLSYVAAGGVASSSDEKLKSDIKSITGEKAIDILLSLKPKEWVWNDKNAFLSGNDCAGLIAQDVNNILPFAVRQIGEYLSLNYSVFHAYEIAGLQNHEQRIVELEKKLEYAAR